MELNNPITFAVWLNTISAYVLGTTTAFSESIPFGALRHYRATFTNADETGVQLPFDLTGWQLRHQIGAAVEYTGESATVPSVVIANADVGAFTISGTDNNIVDWDLDCNTDEFLEAITSPSISRFVTVRSEIWGRQGVSGPWQPLAKWDLKVAGSVFDVTQTPASSLNTYYTAAQTDAAIASAIAAKLIVPAGYRIVVDAAGNITVENVT